MKDYKSPLDNLNKQQALLRVSLKSPLDNFHRQQYAFHKSLNSPLADFYRKQEFLKDILKSPLDDFHKQQASLKAMLSPIDNLYKQQESICANINNSSLTGFRKQQQALRDIFRPSLLNWGKQQVFIQQSLKSPLDNIRKQQNELLKILGKNSTNFFYELSKTDTTEFFETIEVLDDSIKAKASNNNLKIPVASPNTVTELTEEQVRKIVDEAIQEAELAKEKEEGYLKTFMKKMIEGMGGAIGEEIGQLIFATILLPILHFLWAYIQDNFHLSIIESLQDVIDNSHMVIGYISAKKYIQKNGLFDYKYLNEIAIIQKNAVLRITDSRKSKIITSAKANTVVNIMEKKGNWLKVQIPMEDEYYEGWIEESKVKKFKKVS
ncbi:SH3 domain-containing protein [Rummeliibacillus sp. TYF005]|uniref:SH3 domain-containing protein n=1 Tax=unclassified Rummeliibacillus TaxID=2622809 RepID=UPI000E66ADFE|nr:MULTISPECIES: SH3 domain-containing protein [unclassified Rummeliibacillus]RIJ62822.1 SH3 domain-containing protein [Rummeliibacillus sp. POC4]RPJ96102.1 SH3 domain-containing protein [Rummeliibacillus sp. TYF005]